MGFWAIDSARKNVLCASYAHIAKGYLGQQGMMSLKVGLLERH